MVKSTLAVSLKCQAYTFLLYSFIPSLELRLRQHAWRNPQNTSASALMALAFPPVSVLGLVFVRVCLAQKWNYIEIKEDDVSTRNDKYTHVLCVCAPCVILYSTCMCTILHHLLTFFIWFFLIALTLSLFKFIYIFNLTHHFFVFLLQCKINKLTVCCGDFACAVFLPYNDTCQRISQVFLDKCADLHV